MNQNNQPATNAPAVALEQKPQTVKAFFEQDIIKDKFKEVLGKKSTAFVVSILQIVASNDLLKRADPITIFNAACTAATLDLPLNNNLGFAYIIPYKTKVQNNDNGQWEERVVAQFQLGYKGFIQLSQRSGQFETMSATQIYNGQLTKNNPLLGYEFDFNSEVSKADADIIGFAAYFKLLNGFEKTLYMNIDQMKAHGAKYSKTFKNGLWNTDLIAMGNKTVLKLILSRFAPLSVEMQKAITLDQAVINNVDGTDFTYVDNDKTADPEETLSEINLLYNQKQEFIAPEVQLDIERIIKEKEVNSYNKTLTFLNSL